MGCYNDEILFIHIPKCGGWSCKEYLRANVPGMLFPGDEGCDLPIGHVRLADIERFTGRTPDSFKTILAVLRNPYEREISQAVFWATRYHQGDRHVHDVVTWRHVRDWIVERDVRDAAYGEGGFAWGPEHIDLTGWLMDAETQFHVWYEQHVGDPKATGKKYADYGGFYPYWLEVDGAIPENVKLLFQGNLDVMLYAAVRDILGADTMLPEMTVENATRWHQPFASWYDGMAAGIVHERYAWAFKNHFGDRLDD